MSGNPRLKFNVIIWLSLALLLFIMGMLLIGGFGNDRPLTTPLAQTTSYPPVPPLTPTVTPSVTPTTTASPTSYPTLGSAPTTTPTATPTALILVSQGDSLPDRSSPSPTATPLGHIACTITAKALHLREGPGSTYGSIGTLSTGAEVSAFKCAPSANWILVQTARQETGWINPAYAVCRGDLTQLPLAGGVVAQAPSPATNPPAPIPTSTPSEDSLPPPAVDSWRGDYFDNPHLAGEPVLVRMDPNLEFNWILDSPAPGIPADNFSVRWSRQFDFLDGGDFRFFAEVDDGIKIYVDGRVILDDWHTFAPVTYQADVRDLSPGLHLVIVEYFESGGHARIKVWGQDTQLEDEKWQAEYYPNSDLQSPAAFTRQDEEIDFDWGHEAPVFGLDPDNFSVRWQRSIYFDKSGDYKFLAKLADEDRVKIFLDGWLVVDKFKEKSGTVEGQFARLAPGFHTVIVEYAEEGDRSTIKVWWERL